MTTPSDSAIAQAFREFDASLQGGPVALVAIALTNSALQIDAAQLASADEPTFHLRSYGDVTREELERFTQPAAAGELPEAVAYQVRNRAAGIWHDADRAAFDVVSKNRPGDARMLYTAAQLRAAVAGYRRDAQLRAELERFVAAIEAEAIANKEYAENAMCNSEHAKSTHRAISAEQRHIALRLRAALANLGSGDGKEG